MTTTTKRLGNVRNTTIHLSSNQIGCFQYFLQDIQIGISSSMNDFYTLYPCGNETEQNNILSNAKINIYLLIQLGK
jgi:hypothetical protein